MIVLTRTSQKIALWQCIEYCLQLHRIRASASTVTSSRPARPRIDA